MSTDFDVIVVGSGPAGVSASFPLVEAGLKVLLVDGGRNITLPPPSRSYLTSRNEDEHQWEWMVGRDYHALRNVNAASPKLRVPTYASVFEGFNVANKIDARDFIAVGSLAQGGLSNAWGCGVARFSPEELRDFPFSPGEMELSYAVVARRMGVSGALSDDLSEYFGVDQWADPPIPMDVLQKRILNRYVKHRSDVTSLGVRLGRSRVAALGHDRGERKACDLSGNCLWGCHRRALYSATEDLQSLKRYVNFTYQSGIVVDKVVRTGGYKSIEGVDTSGFIKLTAKKIILAAGTLATTRLALAAINFDKPVTLQSCPTAAFVLWLPAMLGNRRVPAFGLGQLSFALSKHDCDLGFGSLFNTTGIPVAEFARYMPLGKRYGIDVLRAILSSCAVGNLFLAGRLSASTLFLGADGALRVEGHYRAEVAKLMDFSERRLRKVFWKLGAVLLPKSFTVGKPGGDIHYACSLPMRMNPVLGETNALGGLAGMDHVHVVDGACLSSLPEKSHTLTIMANADRIGRKLAMELRFGSE